MSKYDEPFRSSAYEELMEELNQHYIDQKKWQSEEHVKAIQHLARTGRLEDDLDNIEL